ncbi:2-succinyl-5-enolpyruvyl-6-hydroxy-3-cyclohexene-1-carboxylic-acid synthase [Erwinia sorbitola]|uniref:2-succinyl-5-enolpyruvyl-6-hydroxy-3-cyclohexene-1-carboxylate synthase n=1 Tax=Erwinia sorbitola TaxID=2681984 RepID=A0A6I6EIB7_9GAMM|nr:2-succinyl-5-enolpyruvyl-6-hydroxy-3-cyclohexene-1-carboxylic-acid synthase [Erwinia sorbitola]MTD28675.1 2-succinyl-5-enolpyruvyl-6-hydroxy-3-cyclohexene-1-carboxylic-acid synthase [Erwinia sorbitola]QGU89647.1 2-succinyl-5-enolpyruvyl-6-hydroxy-3-cyclohexene-1-carboxylic-acid synthase [Erwinia sorbitola]
MSHATFNRRWATVLLETLTRHGVRHICIAPGSRSAPLALAAASSDKWVCHTHFDERGLGFLALGLAKTTHQPVAVIVTSGTAVANLHPALVEAHLTGEKLIAISADRPPELINCGANQAIEQPGIFAPHVSASLNLPRPSPAIPARWLVSAVDTLLAQQQHGGVHINCPFAEPLYGADSADYLSWQDELGSWWHSGKPWLSYPQQSHAATEEDWPQWREKRGVVIVGRVSAEQGKQLAAWAATLGWPLLGDVVSQTGQPLPSASLWLAHPMAQQALADAQIVVQFGGSLTGKNLLNYQNRCRPEMYWLVDQLPGQRHPGSVGGRRIQADISDWLQRHPAVVHQPWCPQLATLAQRTTHYLQQHLQQFGEAQLAHRLTALLPENGALFIGNSLSIRLADAFAQLPAGYPLYCNRGASGIDGLLATAAGVQRGTGQPLLILLGDLSALYDLNSLALLQQATAPVVVVVVNNQGGQIFSMLPTPVSERERFFTMPPRVDFCHAAALFGLRFAQPAGWHELRDAVAEGFKAGTTLIEVVVNGDDGAQTLARCASEVVHL